MDYRYKAETKRVFQIKWDGKYFAGWIGLPFDTVKRWAVWTPQRQQAIWADDQDLMELTIGYSNLRTISKEVPI